MHGRSLGIIAMLSVTALSVGGCSGGSNAHKSDKITIDSVELADPGKALKQAKSKFLAANQSAIDSKSATIADDSDCFFRRTEKGSDDYLPKIFCGPIKRAGYGKGKLWDVYSATILGTDDESAAGKVSVNGPLEVGKAADATLLVRPDGASPAPEKDVAAAKAPQASFHDYAYLMDAGETQTGLNFSPLQKPATIVTPSATVSVIASAKSATVPGWFADAAKGDTDESNDSSSDEPSGSGVEPEKSTSFRPADGQQVVAYKLTIGPGSAYPDPNSSDYGDDGEKDASTKLSLSAGGQQLTIHHAEDANAWGGSGDSDGTMTIECERVPCSSTDGSSSDNNDYILIATLPKDAKPKISASVDGHTLAVPTSGGEVTSDVSNVNQARKSPVQQVNSTIPDKKWESPDDDSFSQVTYTSGGSIPVAFLAAFDAQKGWAPEGKAWLEIPVTDMPHNDSTAFTVSWAKSITVTADGKTYHPDTDAGLEGSFGILVPDSFTKGELKYAPQGTATYGYPEKTKHFKVDPFTVKLSIPK